MAEPCPPAAAVAQLVPMAFVADVARSVRFYARLGFALERSLAAPDGGWQWAAVASGRARLMFTRASAPVVPEQQAILFYLYTADLEGLRAHLLRDGLRDGGAFCGRPVSGEREGLVFRITYPDYMPKGEMRVEDPDRYCLLIGQLE